MDSRRTGPRNKSYSLRHKRRLVQQQNEKDTKRTALLIDQILNEKRNIVKNNTAVRVVQEIQEIKKEKNENSNKNSEVQEIFPDPNQDVSVGSIIEETSVTETSIDLIFDEIDEAIIQQDDEVTYRYSDCDDSDSNEESDEEFDGECNSEESAKDICQKISTQLQHVFGQWAIECLIPKAAQKKFLRKLRDDMLKLPLDPRTIIKAPKHGEVHLIKGGEYCHFGLKHVLKKIVANRIFERIIKNDIGLLINIDGAPLGNDCVKNLWPILCSDTITRRVYIIGVYVGKSKPEDVDEFLYWFVEDAKLFINNGFDIDDIQYNILIDGMIFDAPAKAYILGVKCHSGYCSCSKCEIRGTYRECVCFPGEVGVLRTDDKFQAFDVYKNQGYQLKKTIICEIPRFGVVTQVPVDPMHLVSGSTKKIFLILRFAATKHRLPIAVIDKISEMFIGISPFVPYEFARKPRDLKFIKQFKATELRQIQLYTGVVALKNNVNVEIYDNFVTLHIIITIYSNPILCRIPQWVDYAEKLSTIFVQQFRNLYGTRYVSHNIHNIQHLALDVRRYGELENFSAFRFENFIARIKRLLRSGNKVSEQLINRCSEIEMLQEKPSSLNDNTDLRHIHTSGPIPDRLKDAIQYKIAVLKLFKINCHDGKNNYVYIENKHAVEVLNIVKNNSDVYVVGRTLKIIGSLYELPYSSTDLGIHVVSSQQNLELLYWHINSITAKLFIMPYKENYVVFPILHTFRLQS
ncbi:uncharacterized protein LOC131663405 [Phymastichus coffea]|uniref:uncharacterized protein LOC131663405 n=1 Tax=Phymastichus coffea TaxID=108790 RepID=UPI00273AEAC9|nr:uncharacterized protein LOC131663405 [Phymastichus coffea]XP_058789787.1 uncharacterized protein LOC131663405 [Phymastichus coffea]XP_058789788.1 uncharacterized protein LOC131663405 [Phymastichus coffea]XP_058789789.1 uncharacterized protein LOC131663405 [Phymastichus coffea]XP_058789790.1 uncharacterized protein LOC131663405 [Phymastichus coffea]